MAVSISEVEAEMQQREEGEEDDRSITRSFR